MNLYNLEYSESGDVPEKKGHSFISFIYFILFYFNSFHFISYNDFLLR